MLFWVLEFGFMYLVSVDPMDLSYMATRISFCQKRYLYPNVTLLVEMKDKEFISHKAKYALQFGTNNNMIGLSLTFKSIKQKIQFSQHSELISFLMF